MADWVRVPFRVVERFGGLRLDAFLARRLRAVSRTEAQRLIRGGRVVRAGRSAKAAARVEAGEDIVVLFEPKPPEAVPSDPLRVLFEDSDLLAVDKPAGVLVHPSLRTRWGALTEMLARQRPDVRLCTVHRLDRETSGVVLFAKSSDAARRLAACFEERRVRKEYLALVRGRVEWEGRTVDAPFVSRRGRGGRQEVLAGGVRAETELKRLSAGDERSLVLAVPRTGRFHQIRAHLAHLGHPLVGDKIYEPDPDGASRHMLHARRLRVEHPRIGEPLSIEAPMPADFADCAGALGAAVRRGSA